MGVIEAERVRGIWRESGEIICESCLQKGDMNQVTEEEVITDFKLGRWIGKKIIFCGRCQRRMN